MELQPLPTADIKSTPSQEAHIINATQAIIPEKSDLVVVSQEISPPSSLTSLSRKNGSEDDPEKESPIKDDGAGADDFIDGDVVVKLDHKNLAIMSIGLALSLFLVALDETIITTAIPNITDEFYSLNDVGWYGSAYLLTMCCFQFHYGKFYKDYTTKWVFLTAIALFEVGSLLCGISPNSATLIVGRLLSGSGACGITSGVLILISKAVPLRQRSLYTAAISSIHGVAGVSGPLLGGAIADSRLTWRWCFYINLPLGSIVAIIFIFLYRPPAEHHEIKKIHQKIRLFDPLGLLLFVGAMVCLVLGLQLGGGEDSWASARVLALFTLFGVFILSFAAVEFMLGDGATLPPRIAKNRTVLSASVFVMCIEGAYYAVAYYLPFWFEAVLGLSSLDSGIRSIPQIIGAISFSVLAGYIVMKTGHYAPIVITSTIITTLACGLLVTLKPESGPGEWIVYQLMVGIGIGLGMQQAAVIVQHVLSPADIPIGIATVTFFQALGPMIMVSVAQNVFGQQLSKKIFHLLGPNVITPKMIFNSGATRLVDLVPEEENRQLIVGDVVAAINSALGSVWYSAVVAAALSGFGALGMKWQKLKK